MTELTAVGGAVLAARRGCNAQLRVCSCLRMCLRVCVCVCVRRTTHPTERIQRVNVSTTPTHTHSLTPAPPLTSVTLAHSHVHAHTHAHDTQRHATTRRRTSMYVHDAPRNLLCTDWLCEYLSFFLRSCSPTRPPARPPACAFVRRLFGRSFVRSVVQLQVYWCPHPHERCTVCDEAWHFVLPTRAVTCCDAHACMRDGEVAHSRSSCCGPTYRHTRFVEHMATYKQSCV